MRERASCPRLLICGGNNSKKNRSAGLLLVRHLMKERVSGAESAQRVRGESCCESESDRAIGHRKRVPQDPRSGARQREGRERREGAAAGGDRHADTQAPRERQECAVDSRLLRRRRSRLAPRARYQDRCAPAPLLLLLLLLQPVQSCQATLCGGGGGESRRDTILIQGDKS